MCSVGRATREERGGVGQVLAALAARAEQKERMDEMVESVAREMGEAAARRQLVRRAETLVLRRRLEAGVSDDELLRADLADSRARSSLPTAHGAVPELMLHHISMACGLVNVFPTLDCSARAPPHLCPAYTRVAQLHRM